MKNEQQPTAQSANDIALLECYADYVDHKKTKGEEPMSFADWLAGGEDC